MPLLPDDPLDADYKPAHARPAENYEQISDNGFRSWLLTKDYRIDASAEGLKTFGAFDFSRDSLRLTLAADVEAELEMVPGGRIVWGSAQLYEFTSYVSERHRAGRAMKLTARFKVEAVDG